MAKPGPNLNWLGQTIGGRYKISAFIDQGGMSAVYKATDPNLQRTVAVKLIHAHLSRDRDFVRRFEQEAAAVAKLRHPNIIQVYDFNHDNDLYFMVLEYIPGKTLKSKLKTLSLTNQLLPLSETIEIMTSLCEAVAYAHEHDMIHRDLKPANVMLTPQGQVILMDFGVAKMLGKEDHTATGTIVGTAKYMSPEQARGARPDSRSDIYALGVMLYEMIAGQPPFDADTTVAVLMKHVNDPVPDIRQIQSDIPDELAEIIGKALAKDRNDRYQTAEHMAAALQLIARLGQVFTPIGDAKRTIASQNRQKTKPQSLEPAPGTATSISKVRVPAAQPASSTLLSSRVLWSIAGVALVLLLAFGVGAFYLVSQVFQLGESEAQTLASAEGMVQIESNTYTVGLDSSSRDYAPPQQVELVEFWIDQREATNAQYAMFIAETESQPPTDWVEGTMPDGKENYPVKGVTWNQAAAYCNWANKRLPTEAEWEVSARGSEGRLYPWGNKQNAVQLPRSGTYEVGSKFTNQSPFGVFDMAGNVWEWVESPYEPITENHQVLRGGANNFLKDMAYRLQGDPTVPTMVASAGVRCAATQVKVDHHEHLADDVLYQDSFEDPGSGWPILSEGVLFHGYHPPDYFHVELGTPDNRAVISRQPNFDDIIVEADVLVDHTDTADGDFRYGLTLRRVSEHEYYAFVVSPRTQSWYILKSLPSGLTVLEQGPIDAALGFSSSEFPSEKTDNLRVNAAGSNFSFYINNQPIVQINDSAYRSGEVGFFVENLSEGLAHIHYDSLVIKKVEDGHAHVSDVLLEDEFIDPDSGWPMEDEEGVLYRVGYHPPDFYHIEPRAANKNVVATHNQTFGDTTVETEVFVDHTDTDKGDYRYGLVLRHTAEDQYYAFTVSPRTGLWYVLKRTPDGMEVLAEDSVDTAEVALTGFSPASSDILQVDASGADFAFYINGQPVAQVNDADYSSGKVGFYAENFDESLSHIHYESLTIREVASTNH